MGRFYCNGKNGYCEKVCGTEAECNMADCTSCEFMDGSGGEYKDFTTNYDRIKSMSVEEMAEYLLKIHDIGNGISFCQNTDECSDKLENDEEITDEMCIACMKQWLLQEVSDDE